MWDVLSWGGETQALIYHPTLKKVIGINALGVAPTGATPAYYKSKGHRYPPEFGPLAAITPGTPGGLLVMLAEYGTMSLGEVLAPAIQMADGYAIEAETANSIERNKARIKEWKYSRAVMLPHLGEAREAPEPGEIFVQLGLSIKAGSPDTTTVSAGPGSTANTQAYAVVPATGAAPAVPIRPRSREPSASARILRMSFVLPYRCVREDSTHSALPPAWSRKGRPAHRPAYIAYLTPSRAELTVERCCSHRVHRAFGAALS